MVPYWRQDPNGLPHVSANRELILLLDRFQYGLKQQQQSLLKFQLHLIRTLIDVGNRQSIYNECLFTKSEFSYTFTHSDDLLHCVSCKLLLLEQEIQDTLIKIMASYIMNMLRHILKCQNHIN